MKDFTFAEKAAIGKFVNYYVQTGQSTDAGSMLNDKVDARFMGPVIMLAFVSIFICCVCSASCVRTARDCRIALNAMTIRREYQRNM